MTNPNEIARNDNRQSWFGTASFIAGILSWPLFWVGLYAWIDGYMPFRDRSGGIWGNLTEQVRNIAEFTTAVENGDLTKKVTVDVSLGILAGLFLALVAMGLAGGSLYFLPRRRQGRAIFGLLLGAFVWLVWVAGYLFHFGIFE